MVVGFSVYDTVSTQTKSSCFVNNEWFYAMISDVFTVYSVAVVAVPV